MSDPDLSLSQTAWNTFADRLKQIGEKITGPTGARTPRERAEGYRYLVRLLAAAHELEMEYDRRHPRLARMMTPIRKFKGDGTDTLYHEAKLDDDHRLEGEQVEIPAVTDDGIDHETVAALTAMNLKLRQDYSADSQRGVNRFNKMIAAHDIDFELTLPDEKFNRGIGIFAGIEATPEGEIVSAGEWEKRRDEWLPNADDHAFVNSLMVPVTEPGRMAGWIAPPKRGIHGRPIDFEYVLFH